MKIFKTAILVAGTMLASSLAFAGTPPVVPHQSVVMCNTQVLEADIAYRNVDLYTAEVTASAFTRGLGVRPDVPQNVTLNVATADRNNLTGAWQVSDHSNTAFAKHPPAVASVTTTPRAAACGLRTKIVAQMRCPTGTLDTKVIEHIWSNCNY